MGYSLTYSIIDLVIFSLGTIVLSVIIASLIYDMCRNWKCDKKAKYKILDSIAISICVALCVAFNVCTFIEVNDCKKKINDQMQLVSMDDNSNVFTYSCNRFHYSFRCVDRNGQKEYIKVPTHCVVSLQYTSDYIGWAYIEKEPWQNAKISLVIPQNYMTR